MDAITLPNKISQPVKPSKISLASAPTVQSVATTRPYAGLKFKKNKSPIINDGINSTDAGGSEGHQIITQEAVYKQVSFAEEDRIKYFTEDS